MPEVRLRFFAAPREVVGHRELSFEVPEGATVRDLVDRLLVSYPGLRPWREHVRVSVNRQFVTGPEPLRDGDEVAFMPPVSGGAGHGGLHEGRFSLDDVVAGLSRDGAGAAVCFLGIVRGSSGERPGARVERLEFEAYEEMAADELRSVRDRAVQKFGLVDAAILHRIGTLRTGEDIVLVAVTAAHRAEAFEAGRWIMDELKTVVPIWKQEVGEGGARWVNDPVEGGA